MLCLLYNVVVPTKPLSESELEVKGCELFRIPILNCESAERVSTGGLPNEPKPNDIRWIRADELDLPELGASVDIEKYLDQAMFLIHI